MERIERNFRDARVSVMMGDTCTIVDASGNSITLTCTSHEGYAVYYSYVDPITGESKNSHCDYTQWGSKTYMGEDAVWALGHIKFIEYDEQSRITNMGA